MYVTSLTLENLKQYHLEQYPNINDLVRDSDMLLQPKFKEHYQVFKSAVDENCITNSVLEFLCEKDNKFFINENFASSSLQQAENFQTKLQAVLQIYRDDNWSVTVETLENTDLNAIMIQTQDQQWVLETNLYELIDPVEPFMMWGKQLHE